MAVRPGLKIALTQLNLFEEPATLNRTLEPISLIPCYDKTTV